MITTIEGRCQYEGCYAPATHIACGRELFGYEQTGHPEPGCYCRTHALFVAEEAHPEYTNLCPNCGCTSGVN